MSVRLLVVPGLQDSGPAHWQSWLQGQYRDSLRVRQRDWSAPDLDRWAARIATTLDHAGAGHTWIAVAHSFGCLALARHLAEVPDSPIAAALFVAPAEPDKFGVAELGFGPLPFAKRWVTATSQRLARANRPHHATFAEWSFAV